MNELLFRFTLNNTIEGSHVIKEPDGWKDATLKLERDKEYHSLVEFYDQVFISYGGPSEKYDGGYEYILNVLDTQGPDADISILTELSEDGGDTWETLNNGLIDLSSIHEIDFLTIQYGVVRDSFWTRFWNQRTTAIDIQAANDIYGNARQVIAPIDLTLTPQVVQSNYRSEENTGSKIDLPGVGYWQLTPNTTITDDLEYTFFVPFAFNDSLPGWIFTPKYDGEYDFDFRIEMSELVTLLGNTILARIHTDAAPSNFVLDINGTTYAFTRDDAPGPGVGGIYDGTSVYACWTTVPTGSPPPLGTTVFSYSGTFTLKVGDLVRVYLQRTVGSDTVKAFLWGKLGVPCLDGSYEDNGNQTGLPPSMAAIPTYFSINGSTVFDSTVTEAIKLHEAGQSILDRIIGQNDSLYSEYLGNPDTARISYSETGCFSYSSIQKGLHIKGFTLSEKPLSLSFNDFWKGINPIFNLGLGYEKVPLSNGDFTGTLSPSLNVGSGNLWSWSANKAIATVPNSFAPTRRLRMPFNSSSATLYTITINLNILDGGNGAGNYSRVIVYLTDGVTFSNAYDANNLPLGSGQTITATITTDQSWPYLEIVALSNNNPGGFARIVELDSVVISPEGNLIRIEPKEYFYDPSVVLNLDFVNNIDHSISTENIFKNIKIGYEKWESESLSGLDEVQTKHEYSVPLRKIGEDIELYSKFIAASIAYENTRRKSVEKEKDWRLDENVFIAHIFKDGSDYLPYNAENLGSAFPDASNVIGFRTRYNLLLTPKRNLRRWEVFLNGGVQFNSDYIFQSGEGNTDAIIDDNGGPYPGCGPGSLAENADEAINGNTLFGIDIYEFEHPLTWTEYKLLRDNRTKAVGVSTTDSGHVAYFILSLSWSPVNPKGIFKLIRA